MCENRKEDPKRKEDDMAFGDGLIRVGEEALELHRCSLVVDLHTDCLIASKLFGLDLGKRHRSPEGIATWKLHADIPKLKDGGLDAVFFGIVTYPWLPGAYGRARDGIGHARFVARKHSDRLAFTTTPEGIEEARRSGKITMLLGVEGMHMLGGKVERVEELHRLGVSYITMAHFTTNAFAASSADPWRKHPSLSEAGRSAVRLMNRLGMMVDVAHTHSDVLAEACDLSRQPVIVSHSATRARRPAFRNMSDEDIRNVAATGGAIGVIFASNWLATGMRKPPLDVVVDHADHIRELVGIDHLALGSDWDGFIMTPRGMRDASDLPALTQLFLDRGYSPEDTEKILGLNLMRVFRQVRAGAECSQRSS